MLFGGSRSSQQSQSAPKLTHGLNYVSFVMLAYACYLHEGVALLKRLSRSAFIMTQNKELLALFVKKTYEVPLYSNHSIFFTDDD